MEPHAPYGKEIEGKFEVEQKAKLNWYETWADPDGGTGGTCPLQTNGLQKWSDQVGFVNLAG